MSSIPPEIEGLRLGILASGGGSNLQAILDAIEKGDLQAEIRAVISNNSQSGAMARATKSGLPCFHLSAKTRPGTLDIAICETLVRSDVNFVVLAGYMKKIGPLTLSRFRNRIVNIHPALLPDFGGKGMFGINVHRAVLASSVSETGATVHLVNEEYDRGPILLQRRVPVRKNDTPELLQKRVLQVEHAIYVAVLKKLLTGEIQLPHETKQV